jgi:hypothetical protein
MQSSCCVWTCMPDCRQSTDGLKKTTKGKCSDQLASNFSCQCFSNPQTQILPKTPKTKLVANGHLCTSRSLGDGLHLACDNSPARRTDLHSTRCIYVSISRLQGSGTPLHQQLRYADWRRPDHASRFGERHVVHSPGHLPSIPHHQPSQRACSWPAGSRSHSARQIYLFLANARD